MRLSPENLTKPGYPWRVRLVWVSATLALVLLMVGCGGGPRNNLRPVEMEQATSIDEDQEETLAGELNTKRVEELYAKSGIKDRDQNIEEELRKWEHQSKFDFPIQMNQQVKAYIVYFSTDRKAVIRRSLARSSRYLPMIKEVFQEYGLPEDLAYLAMVESGFNPKACSPAGACGMWQFIKGTGLRYGLVINGNVDERQDPEKSTRAAARYLLDLYKQFGSWYLAAASYNCGEGRVEKELRKSNYRNFWELSANKCIPGETRNYVPQMIAATIIARNPKKFGFTDVPYQSPLTPNTAPNIELARAEIPVAVSKPALRPKPAKVSLAPAPAPVLVPQTQTAGMPKQKAKMQAKGFKQTANRKTCATDRKSTDKPGAQVNSAPYVASLFGHPHSGLRKNEKGKNKSIPVAARSPVKPKKSKTSPALLAPKPKSTPAHLAKKKGGQKTKLSKPKAKSKALLVSEAR